MTAAPSRRTFTTKAPTIVLPVAGPVGLGSAALAAELGTDELKIVGVDADQSLTNPEQGQVYLTSILKQMDATVMTSIDSAMKGTFEGGVTIGTLENEGVGLAPYHDMDSMVSDELKGEIETIKQQIIDGEISVGG